MAYLEMEEIKEVAWNTRKGHRHLLEGCGKGRSSYSHSINAKWLRRASGALSGPGSVVPVRSGDAGEKVKRLGAGTRRLQQESPGDLVTASREALEWQSFESEELWRWHFGHDSFSDDDLDIDIGWTRQSTGSDASTACSASALEAKSSPKALRWDEAQLLAEGVAQKFRRTMKPPVLSSPTIPTVVTVEEEEDFEDVSGVISVAPRLESRPMGAGAPPTNLQHLHDEVLNLAFCPESAPKGGKAHLTKYYSCEEIVRPTCEEYQKVTTYFQQTLGQPCGIQSLSRLAVPKFRERFRSDGDHTIMFHGCRSLENETKIVRNGFQISSCRSGGEKFGTWFAYKADYSNCGYAFDDSQGLRHLFVCVVSYYYTVMDNGTMRVVGQGCAYPQWLLRYRVHPAVVRPVLAPAPPVPVLSAKALAKANAGKDREWYVVRDGKWELEKT